MSVTEEKQPPINEQLPLDFIAEEIYSHYREDAIDMITMYLEHNPQSILYWDAWFRGASNEWLQENDFTGRVYHPDQDHKNGGRRSSTFFRLMFPADECEEME